MPRTDGFCLASAPAICDEKRPLFVWGPRSRNDVDDDDDEEDAGGLLRLAFFLQYQNL
jgi:hypothetical protein